MANGERRVQKQGFRDRRLGFSGVNARNNVHTDNPANVPSDRSGTSGPSLHISCGQLGAFHISRSHYGQKTLEMGINTQSDTRALLSVTFKVVISSSR